MMYWSQLSLQDGNARVSSPPDQMNQMCRRSIPKLTAPLLRAAFSKVCDVTRSNVLRIFREYPFVGLTIDGVTIHSRHFLNVDVVHPFSRTKPFTFGFLDETAYTTIQFVIHFAQVIEGITASGLCPAGVTSDGCLFQTKALNWRNPESLQSIHPHLPKLILVPCVCHRPLNSLKPVYVHNDSYRDAIDGMRQMAVFLRKPKYGARLQAVCHVHCPTRWVSGDEILKFMGDHAERIQVICDEEGTLPLGEFLWMGQLLENVAIQARLFESDHAGLDIVCPGSGGFVRASRNMRTRWNHIWQRHMIKSQGPYGNYVSKVPLGFSREHMS
jgi:hypothetical protein